MNYRIIKIAVFSVCLCSGYVYGMNTELREFTSEDGMDTQSRELESEKDARELLQEMPQIKQGKEDLFERDYENQIKKATLEAQLKRRKMCNVLYAMTTLTMMGIDIANSYWDEKGLLEQRSSRSEYTSTGFYYPLCECPNRTTSCEIIPDDYWSRYTCRMTDNSRALYVVNDLMTVYRTYSGFMNLHSLYQVQQALNAQSINEDTTICNEQDKSCYWSTIQGISAGAIGIITGVAGVVNGFANYPRSIAVWGMNAAVDAIGAVNWYENLKACNEIVRHDHKTTLEDVTTQNEKDAMTEDEK